MRPLQADRWRIAEFTKNIIEIKSQDENVELRCSKITITKLRVGARCLKQASHWHDKGFTPWHAIWRSNKARTRDSVRRDAWRCGWGGVVRAMSWRKVWNVKKNIYKVSRLITTKLLSALVISWKVHKVCVTDGTTRHDVAQTMRHRLDRLRATKMPWIETPLAPLSTPYYRALPE